MNALEKLIQIANDLDLKGLYVEASIIDETIGELVSFAQNWPTESGQLAPGMVSKYDPYGEPGTGSGDVLKPLDSGDKYKRLMVGVNKVRKELGLGPGKFDRQVINMLNKYYPGAFRPGQKQGLSSILQEIQKQRQQKGFDFAGTDMSGLFGKEWQPDQEGQKGVAKKQPLQPQPRVPAPQSVTIPPLRTGGGADIDLESLKKENKI